MKLKIILGTGRKDRYSDKVAKYINEEAIKNKFESEVIDVRDYASEFTIPNWEKNEVTNKYSGKIKEADAVIIVIPEYNHGYPGELKILLDRTKDEYGDKPVALVGVSAGNFGGVRAIQNIIPVLVYLDMNIIQPYLSFSNVENLFEEDGKILDNNYERRVNKILAIIKEKYINEGDKK